MTKQKSHHPDSGQGCGESHHRGGGGGGGGF
eukprot:SAG11_NODE_5475_length_1550_cov_7.393522_3_plen_30_part_01